MVDLGDVVGPTAPILSTALKGETRHTSARENRPDEYRHIVETGGGQQEKCGQEYGPSLSGWEVPVAVQRGEARHGREAPGPARRGPRRLPRPPRRLDRRAPAARPGRAPARRPRRACLLAAPAGRPRPGRSAGLRGPGRRARQAADQSDEVIALGRRLFWDPLGPLPLYPHLGNNLGKHFVRFSWSEEIDDPNEPARILNRLESTAIGCAWLLDRWGELRQRLEDGWTLQPPERLRAIRLLGRQPMDAPQDDRVMMIYLACWAMDLDGPHGFQDLVNELHPAELKLWIARLDDREAMDRRPADRPSGKAELLKIVAEEEERLEEVLELHLERDEAAGLEPLLFDDSDSGERLRRYQLACNRTLLRILDTLERRQRARGKARAVPAAAADPPDVIGPPPAAASTPQDIAGPPVPEDRMPAIDEPDVLDDEPAVLDDRRPRRRAGRPR